MAGSKLVLPGPKMDPASLAQLIADEQVTISGAVPTIWQGIAQLDPTPDLSSLERIMCGGSAVPESLIRTVRREVRRRDHPGLGDDRDEPAGLDQPAPVHRA